MRAHTQARWLETEPAEGVPEVALSQEQRIATLNVNK